MIMVIKLLILLNQFILESEKVKFKEVFPIDNPDLYPGDYLIDFANNIISSNSDLNFDNYDEFK